MRRFVFPMVLVLTAGLGVSLLNGETDGSAQSTISIESQPPKMAQPPFVHTVVVYLKKDTPPAKVEALIVDCHNILGKIPSVKSLWAGRPSDKSSGNLVVKDFSVSLLLLFDNYEGLKAYEDHPTHVKFVETYLPIVEKIQVYDFMNQAK